MAKREMRTKNVEMTQNETPAVEKTETVKPEVNSVKKGIVVDCLKLNIRKDPKSDAKVVTIVDAGAKLKIDEEGSVGDWYKVTTEKKAYGYCMKKYVKIG